MSHVMCHVSCVTCHMSHVMCHMSFFFFFIFSSFFFGTKWWSYRRRVCYQRGLPRLVFDQTELFTMVLLYVWVKFEVKWINFTTNIWVSCFFGFLLLQIWSFPIDLHKRCAQSQNSINIFLLLDSGQYESYTSLCQRETCMGELCASSDMKTLLCDRFQNMCCCLHPVV